MKGYLVLTEARSGSNWLGSLADSTGEMGKLEEWIDPKLLGLKPGALAFEPYLERIFDVSSTPNGRYAIKLFPRHLHEVQRVYNVDLIDELRRRHMAEIVVLKRTDRHRQAISFAKARMNDQWRSNTSAHGKATYDFDLICRAYFYLDRSYAYWQSYLGLRDIPYASFNYEDLLGDPSPYLAHLAKAVNVPVPERVTTPLQVQRDDQTEEWLSRFKADLASRDIIGPSMLYPQPSRKLTNLVRFGKKEPLTPLPFNF